jgi:uncharacterized protein YbjQ (UPF0145 family)
MEHSMSDALRPALAGALLALIACASSSGIKVIRTSDEKLVARPADCPLDFLQKAPARAYEELAQLETHLTAPPADPREVLRPKACELGADAVIVTRNFVTNEFGHVLVAGTAIKYRAEPAPAAETPPQPEAKPQPEAPGGPVNL